MRATLPALSIALMLLAGVTVPADGAPVGPRFQVNDFVVGNQGSRMSCGYYERRGQDVAADALGNFIVVWQSEEQDGDGYGIFARRYNRFGVPEGDEFQVNSTTGGDQKTPAIAADPAGNFVVVWNSYGYSGSYYSELLGRRFAPNGSPKGPDFRVSDNAFTVTYGSYSYTYYHYSQIRNPDVDADPAGNFVVVWQREGYDPAYLGDDDQRQIVAHRFSAAGASQGRFKVSDGADYLFWWNQMPDVAHDASGNFVVTWRSYNSYYGGHSVVGRRFDSAGNPVGGEFKVNTSTLQIYFESTPDVATDASGGFLVVWGSSSLDPAPSDDMDVAARKYDSSGTPLGPEFRVNTGTAGSQCGPAAAHLADGGFVVTWHQSIPYSGAAYGQLLDEGGSPVGGEFSLDPAGYATSTAVAAQQGSDFVVVWADSPYGPNGNDVFAQRFGTAEAPACSPAPPTTCREPTVNGRGVFKFRLRSNPSGSRLTWTWARGGATAHADFGDPFTDTSVVFCVYDASAAPQPLVALTAFPDGFCGLAPCWHQLGSATGPILYASAAGNASGITQIRLTPGAAGRARVSLAARGEHLVLPASALTAPVVVQAQASNGECWSARYDALLRRNAPGDFAARPSVP